MRAKMHVTLAAHVVFLGETPDPDSAICPDNSDLRRLLLHRLEVLEAALQRISELRGKAASAPHWSAVMKPELAFTYDADMRPVAARCTACGEPMQSPPPDTRDAVDAIIWLSRHFIQHKLSKHPALPDAEAADQTDLYAR